MFAALTCRSCGRVSRAQPPRRAERLCDDCARIRSARPAGGAPPAGDPGGPLDPDRASAIAGRRYEGAARDVVADLKWRGRRSAARALGAELARTLAEAGVGGGATASLRVDLVTWAPTSDRRRSRRGFDQAELVAREVARRLRLPCRRLLIRENALAQTGLDRERRLDNPRYRSRRLKSAVVLLVDDVVTTGATLRAAATALRQGGASDVVTAASLATASPTRAFRHRDADGRRRTSAP